MKRYDDWLPRFNTFIKGRSGVPFSWGKQDCCLFAADGVYAVTGIDFASELRGYTTAREALRILASRGNCKGLANAALGPPTSWKLARRGDVVLHMVGRRQALGLCAGDVFAAPGPHGLEFLPMSAVLIAWNV